MTTLVLHEHPLSPYAEKVRIMLREKGLPFESRMPIGIGSGAESPLWRMNPRMEIPALETDGATIYDSTIILEYLEERYPQPALMPRDPLARARARMIEEICDAHWEPMNWGLIELAYFQRGDSETRENLQAAAKTQIAYMYDWLEGHLGQAAWLGGAEFGWGDMAALPFAAASAALGVTPKPDSMTAAWLARGRARASVAATLAEGEAMIPGLAALLPLLQSGQFKRQYRDHRLEWMIRSGGIQVVLDGLREDNIRFTDLSRFAKSAS